MQSPSGAKAHCSHAGMRLLNLSGFAKAAGFRAVNPNRA
jgi:hypothetical protein